MSDKENAASSCPFCTLASERIIHENEHAVLVLDAYPVSPGHSLIISKKHAASWFDITTVERESMLALLDRAREKIISETSPGGFNIGINDGFAAGQTVPHLHMHLIPRYMHDQPDPRGGIRWVIPEKAKYWR
jgi:diadenosine tetraphosphate (Ap4A) HIT family hydrolase